MSQVAVLSALCQIIIDTKCITDNIFVIVLRLVASDMSIHNGSGATQRFNWNDLHRTATASTTLRHKIDNSYMPVISPTSYHIRPVRANALITTWWQWNYIGIMIVIPRRNSLWNSSTATKIKYIRWHNVKIAPFDDAMTTFTVQFFEIKCIRL